MTGHGRYDGARAELNYGVTNFPIPYNGIASQYLDKLNAALGISDPKNSNRRGELIELCVELRACDAVLELKADGKKKKTEPDDSDTVSAWCLWETGNTEAALARYKRKLEAEPLETWQDYWREQIRLIELSRTNRDQVPYTIERVRQHYLKGLEIPPDYFSSLEELTLAMPAARNEAEKVALHRLIIKTLDLMGDEAGRTAWENKLLDDFKTNDEARAGVYLDRGMRAYNRGDFTNAMSLLRRVCSEYPESQAYGDAQYTVGLILEEQQNYDEAIMEYAKLFHSKVEDYARPVDHDEDYKCYRFRAALGISGCYEEKGDFLHALEYAELARDHYKYLSWCKTCMDEMKQTIKTRIAQLEERIKSSGSALSESTSGSATER